MKWRSLYLGVWLSVLYGLYLAGQTPFAFKVCKIKPEYCHSRYVSFPNPRKRVELKVQRFDIVCACVYKRIYMSIYK